MAGYIPPPQYSPVFQQPPQNIYQQLGKPQPQRTHSFDQLQQPQQQQLVPQGFQFAPPQQQYALTQPQPPYALSQTPYQPPTTPFSAARQTFAPAPVQQSYQQSCQQQYVQQQPLVQYSVQQPVYQPQQQQQLPVVQQPQMQLQVQAQQYVQQQQLQQLPTSSFPNQSWRPTSSTSSRPPPISPSASLAKQAAIMPPPAPARTPSVATSAPVPPPAAAPTPSAQPPQTPGRRPLPQPVPGANAQPPAVPPAGSALRRLSTINTNTGSSLPQSIASPAGSASPTRSARPLPTPTSSSGAGSGRRSTVDMGKLPHGASATAPSIGHVSSSSVASAAANWPPVQNRTPSPTKPMESAISSRTANYAVGGGSSMTNESPMKRRASPPRFQSHSQAGSEASSASSSSPVKESATTPHRPPLSTSGSTFSSTSSNDPSANEATPKKFTPMWRRTIPEMPAPAWGYAAGMVAEPHPKPKPPPAAVQPTATPIIAPPVEKEKGKGKLAKLLKKKKSAPAMVAVPVQAKVVSPAAPTLGQGAGGAGSAATKLNSQYPPAQVHGQYQQRLQQSQQQSQRYANWQPQQPQQEAHGHQRAPAGYAPRSAMQAQHHPGYGQQEETEEDDEEEEEETGEEETEEEETEEEEMEQPQRPVHARQYSHQSQASQQYREHAQKAQTPQRQQQRNVSRAGYEDEYVEEYEDEDDTPRKRATTPGASTHKKGVLRPKMSPNNASPSSFTDGSPRRIAEKRAAIEREMERERERAAAPKMRLRPKVARSRALEEAEAEERERVLMSGGKRRGVLREVPLASGDGPSRRGMGAGHERSRSAFDEREAVRQRRAASEGRGVRRPGSAMLASERRVRRSYDDYDDDDDYATLAYDDSEEEEDEESDEVQYIKKIPKRGVKERDWDRREVVQHRRYESSPQHSNRTSAPPMNRRSKSGSAADARYEEEEDEEEEEVEYRASPRRAVQAPKSERRYREEESESYARRPSGLPHPPAMDRDQGSGQRMTMSRMGKVKSVPLKQDDDHDSQEHFSRRNSPQQQQEFTRQFAKMQMREPDGGRTPQGASDSWPAGLPRLPRTPGSVATPSKNPNGNGGYFDVRPAPNSAPGPSADFQARQTPKQAHTPGRVNLNLDDPPPRATVVRTPSPGPRGGYTFKRELPQPQGPPQVHASSQNYPVTPDKVSQQIARRRSLYSQPSQPVYQQQQAPPQRPQSQIYGNNAPPPPVQQLVNQLGHPPFNNTRMQQTPAPPPPIGIESPHPVGGREKMADIPKMEEDSNHGSDTERPMIPRISYNSPQQSHSSPPSIPMININSSPIIDAPVINVDPPSIQVNSDTPPRKQHFDQGPKIQVYEVPGISVSGQFEDHHGGPVISISDPDDHRGNPSQSRQHHPAPHPQMGHNSGPRTGGLVCGGCHGPIIGRIVSAMGQRYHPACFKCTVCNELLEHVSSYEHEGRPYCHLDYHETFAPRCFSCKTAIVEEQFISLDDPALGKRAYHAQHFFCAECGDPFLSPSAFPTDSRGEFALSGDGEFEGFTVYKGHPYCEACHVRLRLPKCKRCKKSIRDHDEAVEALGGKWCWGCFVCASCQNPFQDPSFFQRDNQPYCEHCFSVMLRNEV